MVKRPRMFRKGEQLDAVAAAAAILAGNWVYLNDRPRHPSWMGSMHLNVIRGLAIKGCLYRAVRTEPLQRCSACGSSEDLRSSPWHAPHRICRPCFMVWYDPPEAIDVTDPKALGELSLRLKAADQWPWSSPQWKRANL